MPNMTIQRDDDGPSVDTVEIVRWDENKKIKKTDLVIREANVLVQINGKDYRRFSSSPSHFNYLATGIFITDGFDSRLIKQVDVLREGRTYTVNISTRDKVLDSVGLDILDKMNGLDRTDYIETCKIKPKKIISQLSIPKDLVSDLVKKLDDNSFSFKKTGGTHVVGIYHEKTFTAVEDISRHSAIDKAIGLSFLNGVPSSSSVIVVSCRQTESIINKIIMGGFPIVIGLSAPTDAAIYLANDFNVTLIGFASKNRFNIYTNDWRVDF